MSAEVNYLKALVLMAQQGAQVVGESCLIRARYSRKKDNTVLEFETRGNVVNKVMNHEVVFALVMADRDEFLASLGLAAQEPRSPDDGE